MNILQLLTSLNDETSIRAIAAYSKILKDNNYKPYVFAPLGRELSYFKRWGAEIAGQSASSRDIVYSITMSVVTVNEAIILICMYTRGRGVSKRGVRIEIMMI